MVSLSTVLVPWFRISGRQVSFDTHHRLADDLRVDDRAGNKGRHPEGGEADRGGDGDDDDGLAAVVGRADVVEADVDGRLGQRTGGGEGGGGGGGGARPPRAPPRGGPPPRSRRSGRPCARLPAPRRPASAGPA